MESRIFLATVTWDGGPLGDGIDWHNAVNWENDTLPIDGDDVVLGLGAPVEYTIGALALNSIQSDRPLNVLGGTLSVTTSATVADLLTLDGGTLSGGPWQFLGPGFFAKANPSNTLDTVTIVGDVSLSDEDAFIRIVGGLTVNGLIAMFGENANLSFDGGVQSLSGNADVLFAGFSGFRRITAAADAVLTVAPTVSITGHNGKIDSTGSGAVVNQGTIWADIAFESLDIEPSIFTNLGTLRATANGELRIRAGTWTNQGNFSINQGRLMLGGTFDITQGIGLFSRSGGEVFIEGTLLNSNSTLSIGPTTGSWRFANGEIVGGEIQILPGYALQSNGSVTARLAQLTLNGNLSWPTSLFTAELDGVTINGDVAFSGFSILTIRNGLTLNGSLTVSGADTVVYLDGGPQSITGNAAINLRHEESYFWALTPVTIPTGVSLLGFGRLFGPITNEGTITADTMGKTLAIGRGTFQNSGTLSAVAGAYLNIGEKISGQAALVNSGLLSAADGSQLRFGPTSSSGPVTVSNELGGTIRVQTGAQLNVGWLLVFNLITFNNAGAIEADGGAITIGSIMAQTPVLFNNTGTAQSLTGGSITFVTEITTDQIGDTRAVGGQVILDGLIDNTGETLSLNATTGSWTVNGALIDGGSISLETGSSLLVSSSSFNTFAGVTISGNLDISQPGARLRIVGGLTINDSLIISGEGAELLFVDESQTVQGEGQLILSGAAGTQILSADDNITVTIAAKMTLVGLSGDARLDAVGSGAWLNEGTLAGKITVAAPITNSGLVEARAGQTLTIQSAVANYTSGVLTGGTWRVIEDSTLDFGPGPITSSDATIEISGASSTFPALTQLADNVGSITLSNEATLSIGGALVNSGSIDLGPGCDLNITGAFTQANGASLRITFSTTLSPLVQAKSAGLEGTVHISWLSGIPAPGLGPAFLNANQITGRFGNAYTQPNLPKSSWGLVYTPTSVAWQIIPPPVTANGPR